MTSYVSVGTPKDKENRTNGISLAKVIISAVGVVILISTIVGGAIIKHGERISRLEARQELQFAHINNQLDELKVLIKELQLGNKSRK